MRQTMSYARSAVAVACSVSVSGCAVMDPYIYDKPGRVAASDAPTSLLAAQKFARGQIGEYRSALSQRAWLRNSVPLILLPLSGWLLYRGAMGADATNLLAGGLAGATAYGLSSFYTSSPIEATYLAGIAAINCAVTIASPFSIGTTELAALDKARAELQTALQATQAELDSGEARFPPDKRRAVDAVANAEQTIRRAQAYEAQRQMAAQDLSGAVDRISGQVDENVRKQQPDPATVLALVAGLTGLAGQIAPLPKKTAAPSPVDGSAQGGGGIGKPKSGDVPFATLPKLVLKTAALDDLVRIRETAVGQSTASKECNLGAVGNDFSVSPPNEQMEMAPGTSIQFVVRGGTGIPRAYVIGLLGPIKITNTAQGNTLLVTVEYSKPEAGIDQSVIEFSDGAQTPSRKRVMLRLRSELEGEKTEQPKTPTSVPPQACAPLTLLGSDMQAAKSKLGLQETARLNANDEVANEKVKVCRAKLSIAESKPPGCFDEALWEKLKTQGC